MKLATAPLFPPEATWTPPEAFPDLSRCREISLDLETYDPFLRERGPGGIRKDGYPVGYAVAADGFKGYFPTRHMGGGNLDEKMVLRWLKDQLKHQPTIVGANVLYDLEWLRVQGVNHTGPVVDIQTAEALLDEEKNEGYNLDALSRQYLGAGKEETVLRQAAAEYDVDVKSSIHLLPAKFVGAYGEGDAVKTLQVWEKQRPLLAREGLDKVFKLEMDLIPLLLEMRFKGVRVDEEYFHNLSKEFKNDEDKLLKEIKQTAGRPISPVSNLDLAETCGRLKIPYLRTDAGNPSFAGKWLENHAHPFVQLVFQWRKVNKLRATFIDQAILGNTIHGRIHCQFHATKQDENGTITGRMSSSNPNLQQVPVRGKAAKRLRRGFLPDEGKDWLKNDYSQQEQRVMVHYAFIRGFSGAAEVVEAYKVDPSTDFHQKIADMAGINRDDAKTINFGIMYGMQQKSLSVRLNRSEDDAKLLLEKYDRLVPFVKGLSEEVERHAGARGQIRTLEGRLRHFNTWWKPYRDRDPEKAVDWMPLPLEAAQRRWPRCTLERAHTRKAFNSLIQGSSADMGKRAAVMVWKETGEVPYLLVHDEANYGIVEGAVHAPGIIQHIMETAIKLTVPIKVDVSVGKFWGAKE